MRPVERVSVTEGTVASIKESIMSGDYNVGDRLPSEMELSKTLNVSRSTIRESVKILQTLGFVELKPGRGAFVTKTTENDTESILEWFNKNEDQIEDFRGIRIIVEITTLKQAIKKLSDNETRDLVKELKYIQERFEKSSKEKDIMKMSYYDKAFHCEIARATKDELLIAMDELISSAFTGYRLKKFSLEKNLEGAFITHRAIIEALNNKDIDKGVNAIGKNLDNYLDSIRQIRIDKHL